MKINNNVLFEDKYCKIVDIQHDVIFVLRDNKTKELYYTVQNQIKGILITNSILESKGFKKNFKTWVLNDLKIYNTVCCIMHIYWHKGVRLKYVHQLENLILKQP